MYASLINTWKLVTYYPFSSYSFSQVSFSNFPKPGFIRQVYIFFLLYQIILAMLSKLIKIENHHHNVIKVDSIVSMFAKLRLFDGASGLSFFVKKHLLITESCLPNRIGRIVLLNNVKRRTLNLLIIMPVGSK